MILDASPSVENNITTIPRSAFYHFKLIRQVVPSLPSQGLAIVIHAICNDSMVMSRLVHCNLFYMELPLNLIQKLQVVQNTDAWPLIAMSPQVCI